MGNTGYINEVQDAKEVLATIQSEGQLMTDEEIRGRLSTAILHLEAAKEVVSDG